MIRVKVTAKVQFTFLGRIRYVGDRFWVKAEDVQYLEDQQWILIEATRETIDDAVGDFDIVLDDTLAAIAEVEGTGVIERLAGGGVALHPLSSLGGGGTNGLREVLSISGATALGLAHWGKLLAISSGTLGFPDAASAPANVDVSILKKTAGNISISFAGSNQINGLVASSATLIGDAYSLFFFQRLSSGEWFSYAQGSASIIATLL